MAIQIIRRDLEVGVAIDCVPTVAQLKKDETGGKERTFLNAPVLTWQQGRLHDGETVLGKTGSSNSFSLEQYPLVAVQNNSAELSVHLEHS